MAQNNRNGNSLIELPVAAPLSALTPSTRGNNWRGCLQVDLADLEESDCEELEEEPRKNWQFELPPQARTKSRRTSIVTSNRDDSNKRLIEWARHPPVIPHFERAFDLREHREPDNCRNSISPWESLAAIFNNYERHVLTHARPDDERLAGLHPHAKNRPQFTGHVLKQHFTYARPLEEGVGKAANSKQSLPVDPKQMPRKRRPLTKRLFASMAITLATSECDLTRWATTILSSPSDPSMIRCIRWRRSIF